LHIIFLSFLANVCYDSSSWLCAVYMLFSLDLYTVFCYACGDANKEKCFTLLHPYFVDNIAVVASCRKYSTRIQLLTLISGVIRP